MLEAPTQGLFDVLHQLGHAADHAKKLYKTDPYASREGWRGLLTWPAPKCDGAQLFSPHLHVFMEGSG
jgi:hypothetical protein